MEVRVVNNIPDVRVTFDKAADGILSITISAEQEKRKLGDTKPGEVVKLGNREYIVLGHGAETTAIIAKDFVTQMAFGDSADYRKSAVRAFLNGEFFNELAAAVGAENIVPHTVKLIADDGTGKGITCKDKVSILTTDLYRRYREYLPAYGDWWWTATRVSADVDSYSRVVCCVDSNGILGWSGCGYSGGVRPFCILNSSISIS